MDSTVQRSLRILRRQYLQLVEPNLLRWPDDAVLKAQEVQTWIFDHLFNSEMVSTLPPERYQLRVLKSLTARIERSIEDPEEDVRCPLFPYSPSNYIVRTYLLDLMTYIITSFMVLGQLLKTGFIRYPALINFMFIV